MRVDPEPEQSERALVEVLAAENDAPLRPPTPNPALLPFGELSPPAFERLVAEVVLYVDGLQQVRVYGRSGQAQGGLDVVAGPATDRSVYQVRRIAALTPAALRAAVVDYAGQPGSDPSTRRFRGRRFVLVTGCAADDTRVEDELDRLQYAYDGDLAIELYDGAALTRMLRHERLHPVGAQASGGEAAGAGDPKLAAGPMVALAVVTGPVGVLAGRRRNGVPQWVFPGGKVEAGKSATQAAARECVEETGLDVRVEHEIGSRNHPITGRYVVYLACTPLAATAVRTPRSADLVELRWLDRDQVEKLMPDLRDSVRRYLHLRFVLPPPSSEGTTAVGVAGVATLTR